MQPPSDEEHGSLQGGPQVTERTVLTSSGGLLHNM